MWRTVLAFAAWLPGLALAADAGLMDLVMPDARLVMEIDVAKIAASPVGQMMKAEIEKARPQWRQRMADVAGFDLTQFVQDVVIAGGGGGKEPRMLILVRGSLDPAHIGALKNYSGKATEYQGVPILSSTGKGSGVIAFPDGGKMAIIGELEDVQAAIARRGHGTGLPAVLAAKVKEYNGRYDAWMVSIGPLVPPSKVSSAAGAGAGAGKEFLEKLEALHGGLRLSPDFDASLEMVARTEPDAAEIAHGVRWLLGAMQAQNKGAAGLENLKFEVKGRRITMSLRVPEEKIRLALGQANLRAAAQAPKAMAALAPAPAPEAQPVIMSGVSPPPAGTIRIQSSPSDMGTVLLSTGKP